MHWGVLQGLVEYAKVNESEKNQNRKRKELNSPQLIEIFATVQHRDGSNESLELFEVTGTPDIVLY